MPFYKAKNYEIAFLSKKRLLVKKGTRQALSQAGPNITTPKIGHFLPIFEKGQEKPPVRTYPSSYTPVMTRVRINNNNKKDS